MYQTDNTEGKDEGKKKRMTKKEKAKEKAGEGIMPRRPSEGGSSKMNQNCGRREPVAAEMDSDEEILQVNHLLQERVRGVTGDRYYYGTVTKVTTRQNGRNAYCVL